MCLWRKIANIRYDLERNPIHLPPENRLSTGFPSRLNHSFWLLIEKVQTCGQMKLSPVIKAWRSNPILLHVTCWLLRSRRLYCSKTWWWVNLGARLDTGEWGSPNRAASGGVQSWCRRNIHLFHICSKKHFKANSNHSECTVPVSQSVERTSRSYVEIPKKSVKRVCKSQWSSRDQHFQN